MLIGQHAEWRDNVLFKILVLVITPDQDKVRLEGINLRADFPKGFEHPRPVGFMRRDAFVVTPLCLHGLGPVGRVFHMGRNAWIGLEHACERPRFVLVRHQAWGIMRRAYTENLSHGSALRYGLLHKTGNLPPA